MDQIFFLTRKLFIPLIIIFFSGQAFAAASVSASQMYPVVSPNGTASSLITWSSTNEQMVQIWLSVDNKKEVLFATGVSGQKTYVAIEPGSSYKFTAYRGTQQTIPIASTIVLGVPVNGGVLATKNNVVRAPFNSATSATIIWKTNNLTNAQMWVSVNGQPETLVGTSLSSVHTANWIVPSNDYVFTLYEGVNRSRVLDTINIYADLAYEVGVNYHSFSSAYNQGNILTQYHSPSVRSLVKSQLNEMINNGASIIKFNIWHTSISSSSSQPGRPHFPLSSQEIFNLNLFAQDVAAIRANDGRRLKLDLSLGWQGSAGYTHKYDSPSTGLGSSQILGSEFITRAKQSINSIVDAVKNVYRPDGRLVVDRIYLEGEVMPAITSEITNLEAIDGKKNQDWFLLNLYPYFVNRVISANIEPSLYFLVNNPNENNVFDYAWQDPLYSAHNVKKTMYSVYRAILFLKTNNLKIPKRIDFSLYPQRVSASYTSMIDKILDDADVSLQHLGAASSYYAAESQYPLSNSDREALGEGFGNNRNPNSRLKGVSFWTTPDGGGPGVDVGPPFEVEDYWPY